MNINNSMKKGSVILAILLVLGMFVERGGLLSTELVYADTLEVEEESGATEIVNLSLESAYKKIKESITWQLLEANNTSDLAAAKGYSESYSNAKNDEDTEKALSTKQLKLKRTFANSVLESNSEARVNNLNKEIFDMYFTLQNQNMMLEISMENLNIKKKLLEIVEKKYELGTVKKSDVLNAEISVMEGENNYNSAKNKLEELKMSFNNYFGYELQQNVVLTDSITEKELPEMTLEEAIESGIENRLEIKTAAYNVEMQTLNFSNYIAYPSLSSKYIGANNSLLKAQLDNENIDEEIEIEIRTKYMTMMEKYEAVQTSKKSEANAEEVLMIEEARYEAGLSTLNEVQQCQVTLYNTELSYANALLSYNLAVEDFNLSVGVGVTPANI